ncbi:MAG: thioredoxin domain-containing protein [Gemmatimonadota bacterium]
MSRLLSAVMLAAVLAPLPACGAKAGNAADSTGAKSSAATATTPAAGSAAAGASSAATTPDPRVTKADAARIRGDANAKLWIVVVSDFQCPFCGQWESETAAQVIKEFVDTGIARMAFVNFPLGQHPNAQPAAEAAMCAGAQGKFWEMHDRIFQTQSEWSALPSSEAYFEQAAVGVGVSEAEYKACIRDHVMRPMIAADAERATTGGAGSTPTFFIGNQIIAGAQKIVAFRAAIAKAQSALPQ